MSAKKLRQIGGQLARSPFGPIGVRRRMQATHWGGVLPDVYPQFCPLATNYPKISRIFLLACC